MKREVNVAGIRNEYFDIRPPSLGNPQAVAELAKLVEDGLICVTTRSPMRLRRAVHRLARYFQREERYDFVQYGDPDDDTTARAYLWVSAPKWPELAVGACCFRWREWSNAPAGWAMQWIWLHPYERGRGRLTRAWPFFRKEFGQFHCEGPLSDAMVGFLRKHDPAALEAE